MKTYHKNPRQITERQFKDLEKWLEELGDLSGIVHDLNSDEVIGGNQRARVFDILRQENAPIVLTDEFDPPTRQGTVALGYIQWRGERYGYRQVKWTARQCEQANVVANRAGGAWDWDVLANEFEMGDLLEWGFTEFDFQMAGLSDNGMADLLGVAKDAKPNPRNLPIDAVYTATFPASCCLAVNSGLLYGFQSGKAVCGNCGVMNNHGVVFIDNDYHNYDHLKHLRDVKIHRPKYATVRDVMSRDQCQDAGIEYFELSRCLDWAEELQESAKNIIVIPKYDCLDRIPEKFVLGYSVPTSHGGTPLPVAMFRGRRVHLLGGSWKAQLAHMAELGDGVVSFDNNYIGMIAQKGGCVLPDGTRKDLPAWGIDTRVNPQYIALAISLGNIGWMLNDLYAGSDKPG